MKRLIFFLVNLPLTEVILHGHWCHTHTERKKHHLERFSLLANAPVKLLRVFAVSCELRGDVQVLILQFVEKCLHIELLQV